MSDPRAGFLDAIVADPEDDTPRLVYADWLEEHDEPQRAELIRVQCELARLEQEDSPSQAVFAYLRDRDPTTLGHLDWEPIDPEVARRLVLRDRAQSLLEANRHWWESERPRRCGLSARVQDYERGFLGSAATSNLNTVIRTAPRGVMRLPLRKLHLENCTDEQARDLAHRGVLGRLRALRLESAATGALATLSKLPEVAGINDLSCDGISVENIRSLAKSSNWHGLRQLLLSGSRRPTIKPLLRAAHLRQLTCLELWSCQGSGQVVESLTKGGFSQLRELSLVDCGADDTTAEILAGSPAMAGLHTLGLPTSQLTGHGVSMLLSSAHLRRLAVLNLYHNEAQFLEVERLATAPALPLRVLNIECARLPPESLAALARSPAMAQLVWLNLEDTGMSADALRLLPANGFPSLAVLHLQHNTLDDAAITALAKWPGLAHVRCLYLGGNSLGPDGARALARCRHADGLQRLEVDLYSPGTAGIRALRKRFGKALVTC